MKKDISINPCKICALRNTETLGPSDCATCKRCNERIEDAKAEKCQYCDAEENKDIFFNWLPAIFGIETEHHVYNPDVTVFITDDSELELCVMMSDDYLVKEKKKINFCPFCGRRLRND